MVINELLEVLFFRNLNELIDKTRYLNDLYYPNEPEKHAKEFDSYVFNTIKSKENLLSIIEDYSQNGLPLWQKQEAQNCDNINSEKLTSIMTHGTIKHVEETFNLYMAMREKWACHLDDYSKLVNYKDNIVVLVLATGAGLGTCAVMKDMQPNSKMISIDIDFGAAKNADGLARYLDIENRACGLNASFWKLPFEDDLIDVVCTHYGVDESGELPTTLSQISKVLKSGGKFIGVCRKHPFVRHRRFLKMFDINEEECNILLEKARLYSGFDNLIESAKKLDLKLNEYREFIPLTSHDRILFEFVKR
ncbi:MAG: class I SAM-dependent methyltransferase [Saccharofermentanales bacterium]